LAAAPFNIRVAEPVLVVSFARSCQVVSWAPLHGGFRSGVSHILVQQMRNLDSVEMSERSLRQAAGRLGLKGTVVGKPMTENVDSHRTTNATAGNVSTYSVALGLNVGGRLLMKRTKLAESLIPGAMPRSPSLRSRLSHEAMLEAMAMGVEAKTIVAQAQRAGKRTGVRPVPEGDRLCCRGDL
jgi:hypothetical protein